MVKIYKNNKERIKKEEERLWLNKFLEINGIALTAIQNENSSTIDFVIKENGRLIGIELTRLFIEQYSYLHNRIATNCEQNCNKSLFVAAGRLTYYLTNILRIIN